MKLFALILVCLFCDCSCFGPPPTDPLAQRLRECTTYECQKQVINVWVTTHGATTDAEKVKSNE